MLQLAYFDRDRDPVVMDIGPVLDLEDVAGGKTCALAGRVEPRDYADTAAMLGRYSPAQLIASPGVWTRACRARISPTRVGGLTGCRTGRSRRSGSAPAISPSCGAGSPRGPGLLRPSAPSRGRACAGIGHRGGPGPGATLRLTGKLSPAADARRRLPGMRLVRLVCSRREDQGLCPTHPRGHRAACEAVRAQLDPAGQDLAAVRPDVPPATRRRVPPAATPALVAGDVPRGTCPRTPPSSAPASASWTRCHRTDHDPGSGRPSMRSANTARLLACCAAALPPAPVTGGHSRAVTERNRRARRAQLIVERVVDRPWRPMGATCAISAIWRAISAASNVGGAPSQW
jgi:hypothetical protein